MRRERERRAVCDTSKKLQYVSCEMAGKDGSDLFLKNVSENKSYTGRRREFSLLSFACFFSLELQFLFCCSEGAVGALALHTRN